jgi:hypothetical protein
MYKFDSFLQKYGNKRELTGAPIGPGFPRGPMNPLRP